MNSASAILTSERDALDTFWVAHATKLREAMRIARGIGVGARLQPPEVSTGYPGVPCAAQPAARSQNPAQ